MLKAATLAIIFTLAANAKSEKIPDRRDFPLNSALNPCDNFYDYVCSKVTDSFQLREDRSAHTFAFNDSAERILEKKKEYFAKLTKIKPKSDRESTLKNYYSSCMNAKAQAHDEKSEIKRLTSLIGKIQTREQLYKWLEQSYLSTDTSPLGWGSIANLDNPLKNDLYMSAAYMSLPEKTYYKKEDLMKDFEASIVSFFKAINEPNAEAQAKNVLKFESGLAEVVPSPQEFRQLVNDRLFISRAELKKTFEFLKFDDLLQEIPDDIPIRHWTPDAFKYMNTYFSTASIEEIKSVITFHALSSLIDDSDPKYFQVKFDFSKKHLGGSNIRAKRDERCTREVMGTFGKELDSILIDQMFPNFPKEKFVSLAESIRNSILRSLETNTWLTSSAKSEAIKKIKLAKLHLVAPNNEKEWDFLPTADYDPKHLLKNKKTLSKIYTKKTLKEFKEPNDPGRWDMSPLTVNAYYDGSYNKFVMPIGILQYPFYDPKMSIDENLAAVGTVIGHELGHGIDDQGSRYDSDGKQRLWMDMKDLAEFSKRKEKLVAQFELAKHNGNLTLGENIGDLVGLTASLQEAQLDPEFMKNPDRIKNFFVGYARLWCEVKRPKFIENQLKTNPHSLGVARVNEQIKQQIDFKNVYQCKDTDAMVLPKDKLVHIW